MHEVSISGSELDQVISWSEDIWTDLVGARLLITGATGFLGRWILASLLRANSVKKLALKVVCLSRKPEQFAKECPDLALDAAVTFVKGDVRIADLSGQNFTHVIHAAADTSLEADANPLELSDTIIAGTRQILNLAQKSGCAKVLFLSSGAVYGSQPASLESIDEGYTGACKTTTLATTYGQSKRMAEQLCTIYRHSSGLEIKIARCFAFVGPHMSLNGHFAIGNFIEDAIKQRAIVVKGDGSPTRSYLYAADAVAWLLHILVNGDNGAIYNVGSDHPITILNLAKLVAESIPSAKDLIVESNPSMTTNERNCYLPNVEKAKAELGVRVWTDLSEAIGRTGAWARLRQISS